MLMLFYALLNGYFVLFYFLGKSWGIVQQALYSSQFPYENIKFLALSLILLLFCVILTKFTVFHIGLVVKNSTTIESLENNYNYCYSISVYRNLTQVFGNNVWLWPLPLYGRSGKPTGDGIVWPLADSHFSDSDVNVESEANRESSVKPMAPFSRPEPWPAERRSVSPLTYLGKSPSEVDTDISFVKAKEKKPVN
jgi:hypothetical protein